MRPQKTKKEYEAFASEVVAHYQKVRNCKNAKTLTAKHFQARGQRRSLIYKILQRYLERGDIKYLKGTGRKPSVSTAENINKLKELYRVNPSLSTREAAVLLNLKNTTTALLIRKIRSGLLDANIVQNREVIDSSLNQQDNDTSVKIAEEELSQEYEEGQQPVLKNEHIKLENDLPFGDGNEDAFDDDSFALPDNQDLSMDQPFDELTTFTETTRYGEAKLRPRYAIRKRYFPPTKKVPPKVKKEPGKVNEAVLKAERCMVCCEALNKAELKLFYRRPKNYNNLEANSKVIFLLVKLLEIPSEEIVKIMETSGQCPSRWFLFCSNCHHFLDQTVAIHEEILRFQRNLLKRKEEITEKIKIGSATMKEFDPNFGKEFKSLNDLLAEKVRRLVRKEDIDLTPPYTQYQDELPVDHHNFEEENHDSADDARNDSPVFCDKSGLLNLENNVSNQRCMMPSSSWSMFETDTSANISPQKLIGSAPPSPANVTLTRTPVVCDTCGEELEFVSLAQHKLKKHDIVLDGFTVTRCDIPGCKYATFYQQEVDNHKRRVHSENIGLGPRLRCHVCQYCGKGFLDKKHLQDHENIHKNAVSRPFKCKLCGKGFAVRTYLYIHTKQTHQGVRYPSQKRPKNKRPPHNELQSMESTIFNPF